LNKEERLRKWGGGNGGRRRYRDERKNRKGPGGILERRFESIQLSTHLPQLSRAEMAICNQISDV
jgi:hypothetical protein